MFGSCRNSQSGQISPIACMAPTGEIEAVVGVGACRRGVGEFFRGRGNATGTERNTQAVWVDVASSQTGVIHRERSRDHPKLDVPRHDLEQFFAADKAVRIKVVDLGGQLGGQLGARKGAEVPDPGSTLDQALPERIITDADG